MHTVRCMTTFVLALMLIAIPAAAQIAGTGTIRGTITDPTGAVVPRATVTAINVATGVETARVATDAGLYVIAPLPAGTYRLTASAAGFPCAGAGASGRRCSLYR